MHLTYFRPQTPGQARQDASSEESSKALQKSQQLKLVASDIFAGHFVRTLLIKGHWIRLLATILQFLVPENTDGFTNFSGLITHCLC